MQRAIRLDTSHASDRFWLAQMLGHSGRPLEAAQELEKAISAEPYNPEYYMYLAVCYVSGGRHREGMEAINRALQLFPENEDMRIVLDKVRRPALNQ
jgi:Flp pilus assembly protein TadD